MYSASNRDLYQPRPLQTSCRLRPRLVSTSRQLNQPVCDRLLQCIGSLWSTTVRLNYSEREGKRVGSGRAADHIAEQLVGVSTRVESMTRVRACGNHALPCASTRSEQGRGWEWLSSEQSDTRSLLETQSRRSGATTRRVVDQTSKEWWAQLQSLFVKLGVEQGRGWEWLSTEQDTRSLLAEQKWGEVWWTRRARRMEAWWVQSQTTQARRTVEEWQWAQSLFVKLSVEQGRGWEQGEVWWTRRARRMEKRRAQSLFVKLRIPFRRLIREIAQDWTNLV